MYPAAKYGRITPFQTICMSGGNVCKPNKAWSKVCVQRDQRVSESGQACYEVLSLCSAMQSLQGCRWTQTYHSYFSINDTGRDSRGCSRTFIKAQCNNTTLFRPRNSSLPLVACLLATRSLTNLRVCIALHRQVREGAAAQKAWNLLEPLEHPYLLWIQVLCRWVAPINDLVWSLRSRCVALCHVCCRASRSWRTVLHEPQRWRRTQSQCLPVAS